MIGSSILPAIAGGLFQGILFLLALLLLWTFIFRRLLDKRRERRRRVRAEWQPRLTDAMLDPATALPAPAPADAPELLRLWTYLAETVRGDAGAQLIQVGHRLGLVTVAREMLVQGGRQRVLTAVSALGHLRDHDAIPDLRRLAAATAPSVAFAAARAWARVDGARALPELLPQLLVRWQGAPSRVAQVLNDAGSRAAASALLQLVESRNTADLPEAVRLLAPHATSATDAAVLALLDSSDDPEVLRACLRVVQSPAAAVAAREHLAHPDWIVRVEACNALARVGTEADAAALAACLGDREWWVRYRAAQALRQLPGVGDPGLASAAAATEDRYAIDMAQQVLAEDELE